MPIKVPIVTFNPRAYALISDIKTLLPVMFNKYVHNYHQVRSRSPVVVLADGRRAALHVRDVGLAVGVVVVAPKRGRPQTARQLQRSLQVLPGVALKQRLSLRAAAQRAFRRSPWCWHLAAEWGTI